ncbi:hypothetical protein [Sulfuracidifex tepidarius]|uniref:Uncharacterized protein n=1 Tax=Sulfuracidifex tepidarius TaxID=1294262 RepID=A0A510E3T7_9CREN|nr:hypothetical protein [Sulfuracidifex tepidarius]BBG23973.1 hypothetical protein IC006_1273 [Sulfuracidifex tepidarius]BBG26728.1 hypothetical protein IC007_1248 [Sulfuracidifex tepidarius]
MDIGNVKIKLIGVSLLVISVFIVFLSFGIIFLNFHLTVGDVDVAKYFIKVLNFLIILGIFGYLAYIGLIMLISRK